MNKTNLALILIILILLLGIGYIYSTRNGLVKDDNDSGNAAQNDVKTETSDGYTLEYWYEGENRWSYKVTGQLPTPCHNATVDAVVAESFPEQVTVRLAVSSPKPGEVCIQVIQDIEISGEFSASEGATVSFQVMKED